MKTKVVLALALLFLSLGIVQAKKVKFSVNMSGYDINANGIHISGDFQTLAGFPGGDWNPESIALTPRQDNPMIYEVTVDIPAFNKYEFKFVNGHLFYEVEFVPEESRVLYDFVDNRWFYLDSLANDTTFIGPLMFGGNAPEGKKLLRLRVNMQNETVSNKGVHVSGSFNSNSPSNARMYSFNGHVYEYITWIDSGSTVDYRFVNGNSISELETVVGSCAVDGKRQVKLDADFVGDSICFSTCAYCISTGIERYSSTNTFSLYPNPSTGTIVLNWNESVQQANFVLFDLNGRRLMEKLVRSGEQIELPLHLDAGVYSVQLGNQSKKLIIQ